MTMSIPRKLHFLWGLLDAGSEIPAIYQRLLKRWQWWHPSWQIQVHDGPQVERLAGHFPEYPFACYEKDIQRCDVCRPMMLYRYGGFYADLDVESLACLERLPAKYRRANLLLGMERTISRHEVRRIVERHPIRQGVPELRRRIGNYFMASTPGHPFWLDVLELIGSRADLPVRDPYDVLYTTGPDVVSEVAARTRWKYRDVRVLPQRLLQRFITHHQAGGWRDFSRPLSTNEDKHRVAA
jgi:mannosyltransferase OCH1-like enzyme